MKDEFDSLPESEKNRIVNKMAVVRAGIEAIRKILADTERHKKDSKDAFDNVYYIMPNIAVEYEKVRTKKKTFSSFINIWENWIMELGVVASLNRYNMTNKRLLNHLDDVFSICQVIDDAAKVYMGEED